MGTKFLSEDKKQLLQKVSSLYFNRDVNENIEADGDLKTIKGMRMYIYISHFLLCLCVTKIIFALMLSP